MKIFWLILLGALALNVNQVFGAEGGMPQLNPEFWPAQIFWLILIFSSLYIIIWKIFLPRITSSLENRRLRIVNDLDEAQKLKEKLIAISLISSSATIIESRYTEVFLPTLHDSDLQLIKQTFGDQTHVIKTENFSAGVENIAKKW